MTDMEKRKSKKQIDRIADDSIIIFVITMSTLNREVFRVSMQTEPLWSTFRDEWRRLDRPVSVFKLWKPVKYNVLSERSLDVIRILTNRLRLDSSCFRRACKRYTIEYTLEYTMESLKNIQPPPIVEIVLQKCFLLVNQKFRVKKRSASSNLKGFQSSN